MASTSFDVFVQREQEAARRADAASIDWQAEKNEWLFQLDSLYARVSGFLKPYIDAGQISMADSDIELTEDHLGVYPVKLRIITIGTKSITLEPLGTIQTGSRGRVDVVGPLTRAQLSLLDAATETMLIPSTNGRNRTGMKRLSDGRWVWKIVTRDVLELNRENFLNLLMEVANE